VTASASASAISEIMPLQEPDHAEASAALQWLPELRAEAQGQLSVHKMYFDPLRRPFADYIGPVELFRTAGKALACAPLGCLAYFGNAMQQFATSRQACTGRSWCGAKQHMRTVAAALLQTD